eukprot:648908-Amphidinium_carterae.1
MINNNIAQYSTKLLTVLLAPCVCEAGMLWVASGLGPLESHVSQACVSDSLSVALYLCIEFGQYHRSKAKITIINFRYRYRCVDLKSFLY